MNWYINYQVAHLYLQQLSILWWVNLPLSSGQFHPILKQSIISPLFKKSTLDKDLLSNYRPVSNLSVVSKIIEHIVRSRLTDHLSSNNLLNPHQSAYCKHHSTETALSHIHDHLINAIGSQKNFLSLSSWPLCSLWYHWPQYFNLSSFIFVWDSWLCSQLV